MCDIQRNPTANECKSHLRFTGTVCRSAVSRQYVSAPCILSRAAFNSASFTASAKTHMSSVQRRSEQPPCEPHLSPPSLLSPAFPVFLSASRSHNTVLAQRLFPDSDVCVLLSELSRRFSHGESELFECASLDAAEKKKCCKSIFVCI